MTAEPVGYQLKVIETGEVLQEWGGVWGVFNATPPSAIKLPSGDIVCAPVVGDDYQGCVLEVWMMEPPPPPPPVHVTTETLNRAGVMLAAASWLASPGVREKIYPESLDAVVEWETVIVDILIKAQKILMEETGEAFQPEWPPYPSLLPTIRDGISFTVYFNEPPPPPPPPPPDDDPETNPQALVK